MFVQFNYFLPSKLYTAAHSRPPAEVHRSSRRSAALPSRFLSGFPSKCLACSWFPVVLGSSPIFRTPARFIRRFFLCFRPTNAPGGRLIRRWSRTPAAPGRANISVFRSSTGRLHEPIGFEPGQAEGVGVCVCVLPVVFTLPVVHTHAHTHSVNAHSMLCVCVWSALRLSVDGVWFLFPSVSLELQRFFPLANE